MNKNTPNRAGLRSGEKILRAAREEFLEKGFEKAKMEDIAKRAGFNKVMLYYHFESKEKLLRELIEGLLSDARERIRKGFAGVKGLRAVPPDFILRRVRGVIAENREIIRLIAVEVLKGNLGIGPVLETFRELYDTIIALSEKSGAAVRNRGEFYARAFIFQTLPILLYNLYSKELGTNFGLSQNRLEEVFSEKFRDTFIQTVYYDKKKTARSK